MKPALTIINLATHTLILCNACDPSFGTLVHQVPVPRALPTPRLYVPGGCTTQATVSGSPEEKSLTECCLVTECRHRLLTVGGLADDAVTLNGEITGRFQLRAQVF